MNIICNSCAGGHIYKSCFNTRFQNPFIWNLIDFNSMLYMIQHYEKINFKDYELIKDENWNFSIIIDKSVKIKYVHYHFNKNYKMITKKGMEVYYNKIWEYIVQKYEDRISRMLANKDKPIFVFADWWDRPNDTLLSYDKLKILNELKMDNIIVAVDKFYPEFSNLKQIERKMPGDKGNGELGRRIFNKFLRETI